MFEVAIEAEEFRGLRTVKQHMLVNEVWIKYLYLWIRMVKISKVPLYIVFRDASFFKFLIFI